MSKNASEKKQPKAVTRCAVYTRKSNEEGLDQDFNTLDAQRESAEAYIASQKAEGWTCLPDRYDDGGFTGGNMDRPALRRLMQDIEAGKVDVVIVYKVDRLSRSLLDFAKIMEVFDKYNVAFVSVTQQFNTSTPMGRLVLNVLLSFAQFEREIIGERIRDKIAAQRRKGKWAGGYPVLGYDVDRTNRSPKLIVNADEAARVRAIFNLYLELGSILRVAEELQNRGWTNKQWITKKGGVKGGRPFENGSVYCLLTNPIYIGKVKHKTDLYDGEHESLITLDVFQKVQQQLHYNGRTGGARLRNRYGALLRGLLFCKACGRTMVHTFTSRGPRRYRYYTCTHAIHGGRHKCPSGSLPASEIEQVVVEQIHCISKDATLRDDVFQQAQAHIDGEIDELKTQQKQLQRELTWHHVEVRKLTIDSHADSGNTARIADLHEEIARVEGRLTELRTKIEGASVERLNMSDVDAAFVDFDNVWNTLSPREQADVLSLLIASVEFDSESGTISVSFHNAGIKSLAQSKIGDAA
ncbi:MAG: recombinase family protein [Pirellulaceae bacterium]